MSEDGVPQDGATEGRGASHLQPVDGEAAPRVLTPKHLADLESSGLDAHSIAWSGVYSEGKSAPIADLLGWGWRNGGGLVIPFRDYDSQRVVLCRVKPDRPRVKTKGSKRRAIKYEQAPGTGAVPYFGPRTIREQRLHSTALVVWTEGEKKTLALDQLGFAAIGLTGCHNFNDAKKLRDGDGLQWSDDLKKYGDRFVAGKDHVICFDSDAFTNDNVMLALRRLAGLLLATGARSVSFVRIPGEEDAHVGIDDYFVAFGEEKTRALFAKVERIAVGEEVTPIEPTDPLVKLSSLAWLRPAKIDPDLRLPPRFEVRRDRSLWIEPADAQAEQREVMRTVVVPVRMMRELGGEEERVEIAWYARGGWRRAVVDRRSLKDARRVLNDLPPSTAITSNNAALVVLWIEEYMRHNEERLRAVQYVRLGGWQPEVEGRCFMLHEPVSKGTDTVLVADDTGDRAEILASLKPRGKSKAHFDVIREVFEADPTGAIMILSTLSAPLLGLLDAPNYGVNLYGDSSTGKTSLMKAAGSIFGNPKSPQWVASWNATAAAMEVRAETLRDLCLQFDEAGAGDASMIERMVYMLINGTGRARSNRALGVRETPSWRTVVHSTGERELVDRFAATGAQIRLLQYRVSRFGGERGAAWVDGVRERCEANHGHVGRAWIDALVEVEDWGELLEEYERAKAFFRERAEGQLMQRQAVYYALLWLVECLAHDVLGIGTEDGSTVVEFFTNDDDREEIESASERGIESVSQWLTNEPKAFASLEYNSAGHLVSHSTRYVREVHGARHADVVYVLTSALRARFAREGISYTEVVQAWRAAGFTKCDAKRNDTRVKFDGKRVRVVALLVEALQMDALATPGAQTNADFAD